MDEKVYVAHHAPVDPPVTPKPVEPLNYADRLVPPQFIEQFTGWIRRLGGWPQVVFAFGLAIALSAVTNGVSSSVARDESAFFAFIGGLMIGLVVRVPLRRDF